MSNSRRHHYIPQFLIKKFGDELWVYDKDTKRINKRSPKSIFFEWGRNLADLNGDQVDNIEKMYGDVDDLISKTLDKVLATHKMTGRDQTILILLVSMMKWRIPEKDSAFNEIVKSYSIDELGLNIRPKDSSVKLSIREIEKLKDMELINKSKRLLISLMPLLNAEKLEEIHRSCFIVSYDQFPSLIGDNPIIEYDETELNSIGDFIFPLSEKETFICRRGAKKFISNPAFYFQKDLLVLHQSKKYVACGNREQLEKMLELYSRLEEQDKTHYLKKYVFNFVE